jgi:2-polyprenyl-6-methoxyphenol hydroxylase-like FAD-dependent oxidoreductase
VTNVLIVGAGPVGLCCAIDLLRRGVSCRIIEQASAFAVGTRARGISARTQEIFESLGVLHELHQALHQAILRGLEALRSTRPLA